MRNPPGNQGLLVPRAVRCGGETWSKGHDKTWQPWTRADHEHDAARLKELLVKKGVTTPQQAARLTQPQGTMPTGQSRETARKAGASYRTTP